MNKANYLSVATAADGNGCYPLSAQGLEFIQNQILLLQEAVSAVLGGRCIIKRPSESADGLVAIDGEIMPLKACQLPAKASGNIQIISQATDIVADGVTYPAAREIRYAQYNSIVLKPPVFPPFYPFADFRILTSLLTLDEQLNSQTE